MTDKTDSALWGPPMPFWEAIRWSKWNYAGLFNELPDNWAKDAPGTVFNVGLNSRGAPYAIFGNHALSSDVDRLVRERDDWHASLPFDAITMLGKVTNGEPYALPRPYGSSSAIVKPREPPDGEIICHIDHVDWSVHDRRISVCFEVLGGKPDDQFIVDLRILCDPLEADAVSQLGELEGGEAWHRVQHVIGPGLSGSRLERGLIHGVRSGERYITGLDPRGLSETSDLTLLPTVYRVEQAQEQP